MRCISTALAGNWTCHSVLPLINYLLLLHLAPLFTYIHRQRIGANIYYLALQDEDEEVFSCARVVLDGRVMEAGYVDSGAECSSR